MAKKIDTSDIPEAGVGWFKNAKLRDLSTEGISELTCAAVDAEGERCPECGDGPDSRGKLLIFATRVGARIRVHDGKFCSKDCHDRWHGLKPNGVN